MEEVSQEREAKERTIWPEFYATEAMIDRRWTEANYEMRHVGTRLAVHGFHHHVCEKRVHHEY